jgi:hypothetical protein
MGLRPPVAARRFNARDICDKGNVSDGPVAA